MLYLLGVLAMFAGIALSIALHEIGHLVPAKRFGVRVPQYMVGFGPTVWSRRVGETEYGVKAVPLGGYIRMIGMFPPKPGQEPGTVRVSSTGRFSQLVDEARNETLAELGPGDEDRVFYRLSVPKKLVIMLGGPLMNALIATVLFTALFTLHGTVQLTPKVSSVSTCVNVQRVQESTPKECTPDMPRSPAAVAGLRPGDVITSINGHRTRTWDDVRDTIRGNMARDMTLVVSRGGQEVTLRAKPLALDLPVYDPETGEPRTGADGKPLSQKAGFLGASGTPAVVPLSISEVPAQLWDLTTRSASVIFRLPEKMVGVVKAAFGSGERDPNGPISVVGVGRVAGESTAMSDIPASHRAWQLLGLVASLNLALFLFNLIPLLPLDGGHVAGALWEGVKRSWARLRGRPDPGYVDVAKALPVAYAVSMVLIVMTVLLVYADLVNPVKLG